MKAFRVQAGQNSRRFLTSEAVLQFLWKKKISKVGSEDDKLNCYNCLLNSIRYYLSKTSFLHQFSDHGLRKSYSYLLLTPGLGVFDLALASSRLLINMGTDRNCATIATVETSYKPRGSNLKK